MCFYCKEAKEQNFQDFVFPSVNDVYEHWLLKHSNGISNADAAAADATAKRTPFRFYLVDLLCCNMDACRYFSSFRGLQRHHKKKHTNSNQANKPFVAVLNGRCALCLQRNALHDHVCSGMQLDLYNPVVLTDTDLAELQAIKCEKFEQNRSKQIECQHCGCIFGTRQEMTQHHYQKHA